MLNRPSKYYRNICDNIVYVRTDGENTFRVGLIGIMTVVKRRIIMKKTVFLIFTLLFTLVMLISLAGCMSEKKAAPTSTAGDTTSMSVTTAPATQSDEHTGEPMKRISLPFDGIHTGSLILVNASSPYCYRLSEIYTPAELDSLPSAKLAEMGYSSLYPSGDGYLLKSRLIFLRTEACDAFKRMVSAFRSESGRKDIQVCYGYRMMGEGKDEKSLSSERISGLVLELNVYTGEGSFSLEHTSKKKEYFDWFATNCAHYGFIMTGESGYFRYVGTLHAEYMYENSLTLSEYLDMLKGYTVSSPLTVKHGNDEYRIFYLRASEGVGAEFDIPESDEYTVSGDNVSGYIVWVK